jgi:hypothetical protein
VAGIIAISISILWSVFYLLFIFADIAFLGTIIPCFIGIAGAIAMLAAIIMGIISLATGAGRSKILAILGIILGISYILVVVGVSITAAILALYVL